MDMDIRLCSSFTATKQILNSFQIFAHYDPSLPITMAGGTSAYGIGSVIFHVIPDSNEPSYVYCFCFANLIN